MATAKASLPVALISLAVALAASRLRSAITGIPPSAARRIAICLPMPLAAPVTMATLPSKRDIRVFLSDFLGRRGSVLGEVVEDHLTKSQCQIRDVVRGREDFANRQAVNVAHRVVEELQRRGARPRALQGHALAIVADQLADA